MRRGTSFRLRRAGRIDDARAQSSSARRSVCRVQGGGRRSRRRSSPRSQRAQHPLREADPHLGAASDGGGQAAHDFPVLREDGFPQRADTVNADGGPAEDGCKNLSVVRQTARERVASEMRSDAPDTDAGKTRHGAKLHSRRRSRQLSVHSPLESTRTFPQAEEYSLRTSKKSTRQCANRRFPAAQFTLLKKSSPRCCPARPKFSASRTTLLAATARAVR